MHAMDITPDTSVRSYPSTALSPNTVNTTPHQKYFDQNPPTHCYSTPNPKQPILCTSLVCPPTTVRGGEEPMYPTSPQPEPTFMCVCVCVCVQCCRSTIHGIQNRPPPPAPKETAKKMQHAMLPAPAPARHNPRPSSKETRAIPYMCREWLSKGPPSKTGS